MSGQAMEHKTFPGMATKVDGDQGTVEQVVAMFGNVDLGQDVIHPGACAKTIAERGTKVRCLDNHNHSSVMDVLGKTLGLRELRRDELPPELLAKTPQATGGLWVRTKYLLDTPEGKGAFIRIKEGAIDEYSIGYDPVDVDFTKAVVDGKEMTVRNIRALRLWEYSPVIWGMNPATATLSVKGATPFADLPLAPRERAWDAGAATGRVRSWAGAEDAPNPKYRRGFLWYDADAPEDFGSYKLPFADVLDGTLTAVPRGIFAAAGALQGARGGKVDIGGDEDAVKAHVARYYAKMREEFDDESIVPPWEEGKAAKEMTDEGPVQRMGDMLVASMRYGLDSQITDWLGMGLISIEEHETCRAAADRAFEVVRQMMPPEVMGREWRNPMEAMMEMMAAGGPDAVKAGRVLSAANATRLRRAFAEVEAVLKAAGVFGDDGGDEGDKDKDKDEAKSRRTNGDGAGPGIPPTPKGLFDPAAEHHGMNIEADPVAIDLALAELELLEV